MYEILEIQRNGNLSEEMTFENLTQQVKSVHEATSAYAKGAVNQLLTARNWAIGCYIVEFEQNGRERAEYGTRLLQELANKLNIKGLDRIHLNLWSYLRRWQVEPCRDTSLLRLVAANTPFCRPLSLRDT